MGRRDLSVRVKTGGPLITLGSSTPTGICPSRSCTDRVPSLRTCSPIPLLRRHGWSRCDGGPTCDRGPRGSGMTDSTGITFERGQFNPTYALVTEPEYPGCGTWRYPFFSFGRSGELSAEPQTRWGAPLIVELHPSDSPPWIGMFAAGGLGGLTGVY